MIDDATIKGYHVYKLAHMASVAGPDDDESPGAVFLEEVRDAYVDDVRTSVDVDRAIQEAADDAPPGSTRHLWETFVDLRAYSGDVTDGSDVTMPTSFDDLEQVPRHALYHVAMRLLAALRADDDDCEGEEQDE